MKINIQDYYEVLSDNYVLICTSNSIEKEEVNRLLINKRELEINMDTTGCCIGLLADRFVVHLSGQSGIGKVTSIARLIISFIGNENIPNPAKVILAGFCWGNPNKVKINDLLISSSVLSLNSQKYTEENLEYKPTLTTSIIDMESISADIESRVCNSVIGEIISLETLYASTNKRDELLEAYPHVIGGEMEAFGFVPSLKDIPWLVVKAVSDDAGDEYDRSMQVCAAKISSESLSELINIFIDKLPIKLNTSTSKNLALVDRLLGKTLKLPMGKINPNNLNDYLNDVLGPQVEYKLNYYVTSEDYCREFVKYFCGLILEVVQNTIKHGGATNVEVTFNDKNIIINDNGNDYELTNLKGDRGGAFTWNKVKARFIYTHKVSYGYIKKKHKFSLTKINKNINHIINDCTAEIVRDKIGSPWISNSVLAFRDSCESVFVNDRQIMMQSRRNSMLLEVKQLIESGKRVYVAVNDKDDAEQYLNLQLAPDLLKILIRPL